MISIALCTRFHSIREINVDYSIDAYSCLSDRSADRRALHVNRSEEWYVLLSEFTIGSSPLTRTRLVSVLPSVLEVRQDLTEYYEDKMQRVQRKLNNLRKAASSESTPYSLLF